MPPAKVKEGDALGQLLGLKSGKKNSQDQVLLGPPKDL
jgi:hypothetical protein